MNNKQRSFGNKEFAPRNLRGLANTERRVETVLYMPGDQAQLTNFDSVPNRLALVIACLKEKHIRKEDIYWIRRLEKLLQEHGELKGNFWEDYILAHPNERVMTLTNKMTKIMRALTMQGYYSKTYYNMRRKFGLFRYKRDGVKESNLILSDEEIMIVSQAVVPGWKTEYEARLIQQSLDVFTMSLWYGARKSDVKSIVKSSDREGNPIALISNSKGTKIQQIAWHPATDEALKRGLYTGNLNGNHDKALRVGLRRVLPSSSEMVVKYFIHRPAKGRVQLNDYRINHITFHTARHSFATRLLRQGVSLQMVADLMGHSNVHMVSKYYAWLTADDSNAILRQLYNGEGATQEPAIPARKVFGQSVTAPKINRLTGLLKKADAPVDPASINVPTPKELEKQKAAAEKIRAQKRERMLRIVREINENDGGKLKYGGPMPSNKRKPIA